MAHGTRLGPAAPRRSPRPRHRDRHGARGALPPESIARRVRPRLRQRERGCGGGGGGGVGRGPAAAGAGACAGGAAPARRPWAAPVRRCSARLGAGGARRSFGSRSCLRMTPPRLRPPLPSPAAAAAGKVSLSLRHGRLLGGGGRGDAVQRCGRVAPAPRPVPPAPRLPPEPSARRRPPRAGVGPAPRP